NNSLRHVCTPLFESAPAFLHTACWSTLMPGLQVLFQRLAIAGNREAENEIDECNEQVRFCAETAPGRVGNRCLGCLGQVENTDDNDQRGVLEQGNEDADERRYDDLQRLRQDDLAH